MNLRMDPSRAACVAPAARSAREPRAGGCLGPGGDEERGGARDAVRTRPPREAPTLERSAPRRRRLGACRVPRAAPPRAPRGGPAGLRGPRRRGRRAELKHISTPRRRNQPGFPVAASDAGGARPEGALWGAGAGPPRGGPRAPPERVQAPYGGRRACAASSAA